VESGGRTEGSYGSREGSTGGGGGGDGSNGDNGAFWPQTHHSCTCQYRADNIWVVNSVKGKEAAEEEPSTSQCVAVILFSFLADFLWRSRFPSCDSCTIIGIPCSTELRKNGTRRTSCDRCRQLKKACHWDLVGVMGPRDLDSSKRARKTVKKPIISVDDLEDSGDEAPSPATDLAASAFAVRNAANALVTESASI
jgi:hypothetical protein